MGAHLSLSHARVLCRYSHMATIAALSSDQLVAGFQCTKSIEGAADQHIMVASSADGGKSWSDPTTVVGDPTGQGAPVWGPVLFWDESTARLFLFYSLSHPGTGTASVGGELLYVVSTDGAKTFGKPTSIYTLGNISKVTANRVAVVGRNWLLPFWYEGEPPTGAASVLISKDKGATWCPPPPPPSLSLSLSLSRSFVRTT